MLYLQKMKHVIADLHDEVNMLKKLHMSDAHKLSSSRELQDETTALLTRRIVNLKVDGEKFKAAMHALSNMQRILAKEIGSLKDEQKDVLIKLSEVSSALKDFRLFVFVQCHVISERVVSYVEECQTV